MRVAAFPNKGMVAPALVTYTPCRLDLQKNIDGSTKKALYYKSIRDFTYMASINGFFV